MPATHRFSRVQNSSTPCPIKRAVELNVHYNPVGFCCLGGKLKAEQWQRGTRSPRLSETRIRPELAVLCVPWLELQREPRSQGGSDGNLCTTSRGHCWMPNGRVRAGSLFVPSSSLGFLLSYRKGKEGASTTIPGIPLCFLHSPHFSHPHSQATPGPYHHLAFTIKSLKEFPSADTNLTWHP